MSVSLIKIRGRVRQRLRDLDGRMPTPDGVTVDMAMCDAWLRLSAYLPSPIVYIANAFTISAGTDTFTLPVSITGSGYGTGTVEYAGDIRIQLATLRIYLEKRTQVEMDALKNRYQVLPLAIPLKYALYEDRSQVIQGRVHPGAAADYACNLWANITADDLRDYVGSGTEGLDTVSVPGSRRTAGALVAYTAGELLGRMTPEAAKSHGLDKGMAEVWRDEAMTLLAEEEATQHSIKATGRVMRFQP